MLTVGHLELSWRQGLGPDRVRVCSARPRRGARQPRFLGLPREADTLPAARHRRVTAPRPGPRAIPRDAHVRTEAEAAEIES